MVTFFVLFCLNHITDASDRKRERDDKFVENVETGKLDMQAHHMKQGKAWKVLYQGHDGSDMIFDEDVKDFEGTDDEFKLFVDILVNEKKLEYLRSKNSLLYAVSAVLEESMMHTCGNEFVKVNIHDFGNDYNLKIDYTYHAFNLEQGSFEDDQFSSSRVATSKEEIVNVLKDFIAKHSRLEQRNHGLQDSDAKVVEPRACDNKKTRI